MKNDQFISRLEKKVCVISSWPGLSRLRGRSRFGEAKARPSTFLSRSERKTWMPGSKAGHDE
jgi:hypothetical protein